MNNAPSTPVAPFNGYLPTLDGWRAVAIFIVIAAHTVPSMIGYFGPSLAWLAPLEHQGGLGVNIFFALSGLLITSRLLEERDRNGGISLKAFYLRRSFRILPPYLVMVGVVGLLTYFGYLAVPGRDFCKALLFVSNYTKDPPWYLAHTWSLSLEEHFYLLWPFSLCWLAPRRAMVVGAVGCVLISGWRVACIHWRIGSVDYWRTDTQLDAILWGAVCACWVRSQSFATQGRRYLSPLLLSGLIVLILGSVVAVNYQPRLAHGVRFLQPILLSLLLATSVLNPQTWLGTLLDRPVLRWVGRLSFSLYLWQQLFTPPPEMAGSFVQKFPLNLLAMFACATVSYVLIERPMIALGRRLASRVRVAIPCLRSGGRSRVLASWPRN